MACRSSPRPSLSLPVAMDGGRQEFGVLARVEIGLAIVTLALAAYVRPGRGIWLPLAIAALVVAVQALWLLPLLDKRIEARFTRYLSVIDLQPGRQTGA